MANEKTIAWLLTYNDVLKMKLSQLDKEAEDYDVKKHEIKYNIRENNKLIKAFQDQ